MALGSIAAYRWRLLPAHLRLRFHCNVGSQQMDSIAFSMLATICGLSAWRMESVTHAQVSSTRPETDAAARSVKRVMFAFGLHPLRIQ